MDDDIKSAIDIVINEYQKYLNSERIIIIFKDVLYCDLRKENGNILHDLKDDKLDKFTRKYENPFINYSFRLENINKYNAYIISEKLFRDCYSRYTDVSNLDDFIKRPSFSNYKPI